MENPRTTWPLIEQFSNDFQEGWGSVEARIHDATYEPNYKGEFDFEWKEMQTKVKNLCKGSLPLDASLIFVVEDLIRLLGPIGNRLQKAVQNGVDLRSVQPEPELAGLCKSSDECETAQYLFNLYSGELFSLIDQLAHLFGAHHFQQYLGFLTEGVRLSEVELRNEADKIYGGFIKLGVNHDLLDALTQSVPIIRTPAIGVSMTFYSAPTNAPQSYEEELATQVNELVQNDSGNIGLRLLQRFTERLNGASYRVPALFVAKKRGHGARCPDYNSAIWNFTRSHSSRILGFHTKRRGR